VGKIKISIAILMSFLASAASEGRDIQYKEINPWIIMSSQAKSELLETKFILQILNEEITYEQVNAWIIENGQILNEIPIDPKDGTINLPAYTMERAERLALRINQKKETVVLDMSVNIDNPASKEIPYQDLFVLLDDINNATKKIAGALYIFAPKVKSLRFQFDRPASIDILAKKKTYSYKTDENSIIEIKSSNQLMKENPDVIFSVLPKATEPIN
tara:strand:+ start:1112 stop:1762 length:651 start_codon:yes stop_codon:yes gene_type:complete